MPIMNLKLFYSISNRHLCNLLIILIILVAIVARFYSLLGRGGFIDEQITWAINNYYGGMTRNYIYIRDIILSDEFEIKLFGYLPGYPAFLALLKIVGIDSLIIVRIIHSIVDAIAIFALFFVAKNMARSNILALFACGIYAVSPWWAAGSTYLLAESLLPALFILLLAALVAIREHPNQMHSWIALGLFAAILPFFRSEMVLLFIPLVVWAALVSPARKRLRSAVCVVLAFATPLVAWVIRNYLVHGTFLLTPPVKWYAAWAGLGQVPNDYGYFVNDQLAQKLLSSKGMAYQSVQAEAYWKAEYISAWLEHPVHVLQTIVFRVKLILTSVDLKFGNPKLVELTDYLFWAMLCTAPIALFWLLWKRRWSDAFLVALPAGYAVCSLGMLYVDQRYVRYASLSYLIAFPIFLAAVAELPSLFLNNWGPLQARISRAVVATVATGALVAYSFILFPIVRLLALEAAFLDARESRSMEELTWTGTLEDFSIHKSIPDVDVSESSGGSTLAFKAKSGSYLLDAPMKTGSGDFVFVRYNLILEEGSLGIGILSGDKKRWLSFRLLSGAPGSVVEGSVFKKVEAGSRLVVTSEKSDGSYRAVFKDLRWKIACPQGGAPEPLLLFFNKDFAAMGPCVHNPVENQVE